MSTSWRWSRRKNLRLLPLRRLLLHQLAVRRLLLLRVEEAEGVVAGADVEGLLPVRLPLLLQLLLLVPEAGAAVLPQRLPHPVCWAESSWWPTREALNYC